ncbi:MAG: hypothetical protein ABI240_06825 [Sphingomonas sp.]
MTMKAEIKSFLMDGLETRLDGYMSEKGFSRSRTSLIYARRIQGSAQKIDIALQIHPKDNPNAAAAVYPTMEILMPAVDAVLEAMIGDNLGLLEGITGGTSKQPIGFMSEKAHTGRWFLYQPDSVPGLVDEMKVFIERWTMPFLDDYATPEDILATDQRGDGRMARDRAQMMRVVAAALVSKRKDYAQATMEKWLGAPGTRRRYEQVYDYIRQAA